MKTAGKLFAFAIALATIVVAPTAALADPAPDAQQRSGTYEAVVEILPESYRQVSLSEDGVLQIPSTCSLQATEAEGTCLPGVELSGTAEQFNNARIPVSQTFTFTDEWPVGMACFDALKQAGTGAAVTAKLYLDENDQPLAAFALKTDKSTTKWNSTGNMVENVLGKVASGEHSIAIGFEISGAIDDATITLLLRSVEFMYNSLPVMSFDLATSPEDLTDAQREAGYGTIDDMNSSKDHSKRTSGSVGITVPEGYVNEFGGEQANVSDVELDYIRGRGNSTWRVYGKRPYRFKFDKMTNLFGMGKNKHWVLLANVMDGSLIKNRMTLWLGRKIGLEYTPKCVPVDVVMNGEFYGSYLLCEQVRIDENRINIGEPENGVDYHEAGYLFSCEQYNKDERDVFKTGHNAELLNVTPSFEDNGDPLAEDNYLPDIDDRISYLRSYIQEAEDALYGEGFKNAQDKGYGDYMDLDSILRYLWVQEISQNGDAFGTGSTYFYKKPDTEQGRGKIYWGPLWDFDIAWNFNLDSDTPVTEKNVFHNVSFPWAYQLFGDPSFLAEYWGCWRYVISPALNEMAQDGGLLDQYSAETRVSWAYNREQLARSDADDSWVAEGDIGFWYFPPDDLSFDTYVNEVRSSITNMSDCINSFGFKGLRDSIESVTLVLGKNKQETIYIPRGVSGVGRFFPNVEPAEGEIFLGWKRSDGSFFDLDDDEVTADITLTACFVKKSEAIKAQGLFFRSSTMTLGLGGSYLLTWTITPFDAQDKGVVWTSSDDTVATLDEDGSIISMGTPGVATITGTLPSGNSASITVTVLDTTDPHYNDLESITVLNPDLRLAAGEYDQVRLDFQPQHIAPYKFETEWASSDPSVVEVDEEIGVVHALKPGVAVISGTNIASDTVVTCTVTVTKSANEKASNPIKVKPKKVKVKASKLKKKAIKVKASKAFKVTGAKGKISYKRIGISCKKKLAKQAKKKIKVGKSGKITCKKGLKKGTYKVKVKVRDAGNASYLPATKKVTVKLVVK